MASIWKDKRTAYWVACFTDRNGRRLKKTTRETDRRRAEKIAEEYERVARTKQTMRTVRDTIGHLAKEIWGVEATSISMRDYTTRWLEDKRPSTAPSTMDFYEKSVEKFTKFLGILADERIEDIEREHVRKFRAEISTTLAAKTINHHLKLIKMVFKSARREGLVIDDPTEFVDTIKRTNLSIRRPFTFAEIRKVLAVCDVEWFSMVMTGIYTGQRLADVAALRWSNVNIKEAEIRLVARKTKRRMLIPIAPPLLVHLKSLPKTSDTHAPVHPNAAAILEKQGRVGTLSNQFSAILVRAGLRGASSLSKQGTGKGREAKRELNELSFHSLRHTAVTMLKEAGIPQAVVQELIGHDSEQMSEHYTHVGSEALKKAADSLPDVTTH